MRTLPALLIAAALTGVADTAAAQDRGAIEIIPRALFATETFGDADLSTGIGIGIVVSVRIAPRLSPYVGWDWRHANAATSFAGPDVDVEETGYAFGLRYDHPLRSRSTLILRAGGTYNHVEIENAAGDLVADSGHGFGWEAAAGVAVPIGDRWSVVPGVRVRSLNRDINLTAVPVEVTLSSVALEIGFMRRF